MTGVTEPVPRPAAGPDLPDLPVARVVLDVPLAHLDRPFDYLVPAALAEAAQPGVRVRVRFAGRLVGGFVTERLASSEHPGPLSAIAKVVSAEPVLSPAILDLARAVAARYAGTVSDVLRLADPAAARPGRGAAVRSPRLHRRPAVPPAGPWDSYDEGPGLLAALAAGRSPRAVWTALPGPDWPDAVALAVTAALAGGRGALVVLPDGRDVARVDDALTARLGSGERHVVLTADLGPAERYRRWLAVRRGSARAVVGTRAAMFAPVADLGLVVVWDDGDDLHSEPHAPYPHVREVLGLRALGEGCGLLVGGFARTAEAAQLVGSGWARPVQRHPRRCCAARRHGCWSPATTPSRLPTRPPAPPGCRAWPGAPPATRSPAGRCWSRCPGAATCRRWRAPTAGRRRAAGTARGRWPRPPTRAHLRAPGAATAPSPGSAPPAAAPAPEPSSSGPGAPPRSWAERSRRCRCARPGATASSPGSVRSRRW